MDRFLICAAFYIVASAYHSGQWSRGYAKLSQLARMGYAPPRLGFARGSDERNAAAALLRARRREIVRTW